MNNILKRIANALTEDDLPVRSQFCAADELAVTDFKIEIEGLDHLTFPVTQEYVEKLINISAKAKFGLREQTILDENVRNTHEISSNKLRITITENSWITMLNKMRDGLGLTEDSVLIPHLHNMLIYGPGQFFEMHQDSEKLENMVASLVVILPYPHIGGDLIIKHRCKNHIFSSENIGSSNAKCIAFYSDCKHKVEKIKQGYRIALTYNLVLKSGGHGDNIKNVNQHLKSAVADYFAIETDNPLKKLVYFLNHSYTEHSLRSDMLKGADCADTASFCAIAKELGLIPHLALAKIRHCYSTDGNYYNPEIDDLVDNEITLYFWLDEDDKELSFNECEIEDDEICWTKDIEAFEPFNTEYEGYMGNYGVNMDYWYRRAAIILWPKSHQTTMNFVLNFDNAIKELCTLTSVLGNEAMIREVIEKTGKYLYHQNKNKHFDMFTDIVLYIKDKEFALSILSHFEWKILNSDIAEHLAKLQIQYDVNWCLDLLSSWKNKEQSHYLFFRNDYILFKINSLVSNFLFHGGATQCVEFLLEIQSNSMIDHDKQVFQKEKPRELKKSLSNRIERVYELLTAYATIKNVSELVKLIKHLISAPELYPEISLAELFLKLQAILPAEYFVHYKLLQEYLINTIDSQIALGMHAEDDWSIEAKLSCTCEHCKIANNFLHSKTLITKRWPIAAAIHKHVTYSFECLDLPVDLSVERTGSPHKLILVKNEKLHKNAKNRFHELKLYRQKL